jgi:hypothetical protein
MSFGDKNNCTKGNKLQGKVKICKERKKKEELKIKGYKI